jgi:anaerobic glycerol-3-phosphate dehydrogenase
MVLPPTASVRDLAASAVLRGQTCLPPVAVEAINVPVLDVLREIRSSFRATSFAEIAKIVERVECSTFQRLSQSIRSDFRRKVSFGYDIADLFSAFDNRR